MTCISITPSGPVVAEDIRDLQGGTGHNRRGLCRRLLLRCQRSEPIQRAHDRADHVGGHLRIERGRIEPGMSEQNLDQTHIGFLFEQVGGKAVAQCVRRHWLLIGVGSRRRSASQAIDLPSDGGVDLGRLFTTLLLESAQKTAAILTDVFGFREVAREGSTIRFTAAGDTKGSVVDIHEDGGVPRHHQGLGSVHHIAFRVADDAQQAQMSEKLIRDHGRHPTEQKDRNYFRSIYFREPGGVLFEIATDIPGFAVDEPVEALGRELKLPRFLEPRRKEIEAALPDLETAAMK